ncbi:uncharacterized protein B0T15DRAFT_524326 [Chaetomium strumarium]|uniref:Ecp2 effector protein domain-containing protein n=1 Tax=Chaetomium strumarium TaxID=1170767 RepID=A0AAJ0GZ29_9PEZI|nr:hypothetical protein B0T15DRAFT_524326 [Chaetomium strumarium]
MVRTAIPLAALAMAASVAAFPTTTSSTTFSFAQWVEDIISHPDTALTVDEAIAAAHAAGTVGPAGGIQKRVNCDHGVGVWKRAPGRDAAACVDYIARVGALGYDCGPKPGEYHSQMCQIGGAQIVALRGQQEPNRVNCNDVARTAGLIFDSCWRADDTVMGLEVCINSPLMDIGILAV